MVLILNGWTTLGAYGTVKKRTEQGLEVESDANIPTKKEFSDRVR
jgi:hypothetical protein